jgi:putative adhesin
MRTLLTLISALAIVSTSAVAQKQSAPAEAVVRRSIDQTIWVAPAGYIRISHLAGSLRVEGWDRDSLSIQGVLSLPADAEFVVTPGKQGAKVAFWGSDDARAEASQLRIRVPRKSQLWVKTQSADVSVREFEGSLDVVTVSGDVEVAGRPRELYLETMGGNANVAVDTRSARVKTGTGQVTLRGTIDDATISSVSGPVFALDTQLKQARFESVDGRITFSGELTQPAALEFINHSGDIELRLSPRSLIEFRVSTLAGDFTDEWGVNPTAEPGKGKGKEFVFNVGPEPVAEVLIRNFKGAVILRKSVIGKAP